MAITTSIYDHTLTKIANGTFLPSHDYVVNLYSAFTFSASATTKVAAETGATQLTTQYGYTQDSKIISGWTVTQSGNDVVIDASDVVWTVSTAILTASSALIYNSSVTDSPPLLWVNFGESISSPPGDEYRIVWNNSGIIRITI